LPSSLTELYLLVSSLAPDRVTVLVCFVDPRVRKIRNEPEEHSKIESGLTVVPVARPFAWYLLFISSLSLCPFFLTFFLSWVVNN